MTAPPPLSQIGLNPGGSALSYDRHMARMHSELRRARMMDRLDTAAFWTCVCAAIGAIWLLLAS